MRSVNKFVACSVEFTCLLVKVKVPGSEAEVTRSIGAHNKITRLLLKRLERPGALLFKVYQNIHSTAV
jgi:hypothetical protein